MPDGNSTDFARQLELAWAAGFFDGEGWTNLGETNAEYSYVRVAINQVVRKNLERFREAVDGIGTINGPYQRQGGSKPINTYQASGTNARKVLALLWPLIGQVKRDQATAALAAERNKGGVASARRTHCPKGHDYSLTPRGKRRCKVCDAERQRLKRKTNKPHPRERTHCPQGHAYAEHGRVNGQGKRVCAVCYRATQLRYRERQRAEREVPEDGNVRQGNP